MSSASTSKAALAAIVLLGAIFWAVPAASEQPVDEPNEEPASPEFVSDEAATGGLAVRKQAPDWAMTFDADAVNSYVTRTDSRFLVVAAGERTKSHPAAQSLATALRAGSPKLVMDDQGFGDVTGLEDKAIVEKAAPMPVDYIAIVRVFEAAPGAAPMVVVITYDKDAETIWAVSGTAGQPVERSESQGVSAQASRSVAEVAARARGRRGRAIGEHYNPTPDEARFDEAYIGFSNPRGMSAYLGRDRKPLQGAAFYEALGRPDLADQYNSYGTKVVAGRIVTSVGYLGVLGFGTWAITSWLLSEGDLDNDGFRKPRKHYSKLPLIMTGVSLGVTLVGYAIVPSRQHPIDESEARRMVDEHNDKLKDELGLAADYAPYSSTEMPKPTGFDYDFGVVFQNNGAQFVFRLDF